MKKEIKTFVVLQRKKGQLSATELIKKGQNGTASPAELRELENLKKAAEFLDQTIKSLPGYQLLNIAEGRLKPSEVSVRWPKKLKNYLWKKLKIENGSVGMIDFDHNMMVEILMVVRESGVLEKDSLIPLNSVPGIVFGKLTPRLRRQLGESIEEKNRVYFFADPETFSRIKESRGKQAFDPRMFRVEDKEFLLINEIAELAHCSAQTLRNWEKKGLITFEHIPYHGKFLRGIPKEKTNELLEQKRLIKKKGDLVEAPPPDYVSTNEACQKFGIDRTTLWRWRKNGQIPHIKRGRRHFYKI